MCLGVTEYHYRCLEDPLRAEWARAAFVRSDFYTWLFAPLTFVEWVIWDHEFVAGSELLGGR